MRNLHRIWLFGIFIVITVGLVSCSDNPSGSDLGEPPSVPQIQNHQPETAYFDENYPAGQNKSVAAEYSNFNSAAPLVIGSAGTLTASQSMAYSFLSLAQNSQTKEENGKWVWEYSYSYEDESVSVKLTAEPLENNSIKWQMFLSSSGGDVEFEDHKFMEGSVSEENNEGSWKLFPFNPDEATHPAMVFDWSAESDSKSNLSFTAYDESDDEWAMKVNYTEDGTEHVMMIETNDSDPDAEILWNTDSETGYFLEGDTKKCWNSSFENVPCS